MGKVEGMKALKAAIAKRIKQAEAGTNGGKASVKVGFTQQYAIFVHEDLTAVHAVGNAKFLERPFRELGPIAAGILKELMAKGASLPQALAILGLRLQREAQQQVPVDTGALKSSAFVIVEGAATKVIANQAGL